jgi:predicted MFS family arabinose efflux permease
MLTSSVNEMQSSFGPADQGEISGLSRSASNLGSSLGVAIAGSVVVSATFSGNEGYIVATVVLAGFAVLGFVAAVLLPGSAGDATPSGGVETR